MARSTAGVPGIDVDAVVAHALRATTPSARSPGDVIGGEKVIFSSRADVAKSLRAVQKALCDELGRRFARIENKSTFCFIVDGRTNRLWVGGGATAIAADGKPFAYVKITLSDPTY